MTSELRVLPQSLPADRDLSRRWGSFAAMWLFPLAMVAIGNGLTALSGLGMLGGGLITASTLWFGLGCLANGLRCRRVHCMVDGFAMPVLSVFGALMLTGLLPQEWNNYLGAFWLVLAVSFIPECLGLRYLKKRHT